MRDFLRQMLSDSGSISFGRCAAGAWCLFLMGMQVWYVVHFRALVDNATLMSHVGCIATLYGLGKIPAKLNLGS
jgi:hypothetical protein